MKTLVAICVASLALAIAVPQPARAAAGIADRLAARHAQTMPWHGPYYHTAWGVPVALVVPPTAHMQVNWGWGVSQSTVTPIYHQFSRNYPGEFEGPGYPFAATPHWPSHTSQFGVYYVRGPYGGNNGCASRPQPQPACCP